MAERGMDKREVRILLVQGYINVLADDAVNKGKSLKSQTWKTNKKNRKKKSILWDVG